MVVYSIHLNTRNHRFLTYIYFASAILGIFSFIVFVILLLDIIKGLGNIDDYASTYFVEF
jgi:membrane-anchored protein YejM (alkaline phosphatase superfamily)